jgi:MFS family permease
MNRQPWYRTITREQWKSLSAAMLGWMLDAMDVMLYAFALTAIRDEFQLSRAAAGGLASLTLLTSAAGGVFLGVLADKIGRVKALIYAILTYSVFTALTATANSVAELILWRSLVGIGLGGEWSAGSVLVAETWPAEHRGKAIGLMQSGWALGYILAAVLSAVLLPAHGWRILFVVGILPALLTVWMRKHVSEPAIWLTRKLEDATAGKEALSGRVHPETGFRAPASGKLLLEIFRPPLLQKTLVTTFISASVLFAYWGLFTWVPAFLSSPIAQGGAGMTMVRSSAWIIPMQAGAFLGYVSFGFLSDRFGRKPAFTSFLIAAAIMVPLYGHLGRNTTMLLLLGPLIGYFGHGYFSVFGAMLAEIFPTRIRGSAQGFAYNAGRAFSALAPYTIGALADLWGIGSALTLTSAFFLLGAALMFFMPETRGRPLNGQVP